jgi:hypothetical protein
MCELHILHFFGEAHPMATFSQNDSLQEGMGSSLSEKKNNNSYFSL